MKGYEGMINTVIITRCYLPARKKGKPSVQPECYRRRLKRLMTRYYSCLIMQLRGRHNVGYYGPRVSRSGLFVAVFMYAYTGETYSCQHLSVNPDGLLN